MSVNVTENFITVPEFYCRQCGKQIRRLNHPVTDCVIFFRHGESLRPNECSMGEDSGVMVNLIDGTVTELRKVPNISEY